MIFEHGDIITMTNAPRFLQIHTLASYPATLLNRDDSGLAKRLPFGDDAIRTRISSQCLKRHWRTTDDAWALKAIGSPMAVRSREIPERRLKPILDNAGVGSEETRAAAVKAMARLLYTPSKKDAPAISDRQALLIGNTEIDYLAKGLVDIVRQHREPAEVDKAIDTWFKRGEKNNLSTMLGTAPRCNRGRPRGCAVRPDGDVRSRGQHRRRHPRRARLHRARGGDRKATTSPSSTISRPKPPSPAPADCSTRS